MNHRKNDEDAAERQALRHLLLSFPELRVQHDGREVLDSLVEGAAVHLLNEKGAGALLTASDIVGVIRGLTDLEYSRNEVVGSLKRLEDRKTLEFRDASHRSFVFDDDRYIQLKGEIRDRGNRVDRAMEGWKEELRSRHSIDVDQVNLLAAKLEHLLGVLAHNYGAEAASLLYSSTPAGKMRFYDALNAEVPEVEHDLPEMLRPIARKEFFKFFDGAPPDRRAVIVDRLNAAFFFHLLSIDPQAAELVRARFEDKVLYLDTNVLFRLLGLQGPTLAYPATILMSTAEELGIEIRVAQESVEEFHRSLRYEMDRLRAAPITRDAYQRVAAEHPADEWDFMAAYYRLYHSGQVSDPGDFERRFSQLTAYLEEWGVIVDEDAVLSAGESESDPFRDRRSSLNTWTGQRKSAGALDHDTFMPIHVRELRGAGPATPSQARYWFLTFDSRLTPFEVHHPLDGGEVPPCMMVQDWIQVVRPFLARTDDYERAFVSMLAQPLLFRRASGPVGFPHVAEALHRLEKFEELPVPVVTAMIADDAFVRRLNDAKTEEQERKVVEIAAMRAAEKVAEQNDALFREVGVAPVWWTGER